MSQVPYNHPARSQAWAEKPLPEFYRTAHRLADMTQLRNVACDTPRKAAEMVYDIPELRQLIFSAIDGTLRKKVLLRCMVLDTNGFETAMPLFYESTRCDMKAVLLAEHVDANRLQRYIAAVRCVATYEGRTPTLECFEEHKEVFPNLEWLSGKQSTFRWCLHRSRFGPPSDNPLSLYLTKSWDWHPYDDDDDDDEDYEDGYLWYKSRIAQAQGIRLVSLRVDEEEPDHIHDKGLEDVIGSAALLQRLLHFDWASEVDPVTWADLHDLAKFCSHLQTARINFTPQREHSYFSKVTRPGEVDEMPVFPALHSLDLNVQIFAFPDEHPAARPTKTLDHRSFPSLRELSVSESGAVYFSLIDKYVSDGNKHWLAERVAPQLPLLERLMLTNLYYMVNDSPLLVARSLARRYHPRCLLGTYPNAVAAVRYTETPQLAAQWVRDLATTRDMLVEEELLNMQIGWRHIEKGDTEDSEASDGVPAALHDAVLPGRSGVDSTHDEPIKASDGKAT